MSTGTAMKMPSMRAAHLTVDTSPWVFAALLTSFFPRMVGSFDPGYVFLFFALMMVLQLIWVKTMVIETKGVPLEQIQARLGIA
jgi:SP family arabinose:H+ symporter-like MFS transporter